LREAPPESESSGALCAFGTLRAWIVRDQPYFERRAPRERRAAGCYRMTTTLRGLARHRHDSAAASNREALAQTRTSAR
jgi:hypothetical protein